MAWSYSVADLNTTTSSGPSVKVCTKCEKEKGFFEFSLNKSSKDGYRTICKNCTKMIDANYRLNNKTDISKRQKKYYGENKETFYSNNATRRAIAKEARPSWLTKTQIKEMSYLYCLAKECGAISGNKYHVDHIVPLKGDSVCGLHVPWNLQVIPSEINLKKSNKFEGGW